MTKFLLLTALLFALPHQPLAPRLTVADCLLRSEHTAVLRSHPHIINLSGVDGWDDVGQDAMRVGDLIAWLNIQTDNGPRRIAVLAYIEDVYIFVYKHPDDPGAFTRTKPGVLDWHGACLIRLD